MKMWQHSVPSWKNNNDLTCSWVNESTSVWICCTVKEFVVNCIAHGSTGLTFTGSKSFRSINSSTQMFSFIFCPTCAPTGIPFDKSNKALPHEHVAGDSLTLLSCISILSTHWWMLVFRFISVVCTYTDCLTSWPDVLSLCVVVTVSVTFELFAATFDCCLIISLASLS